MSNKNENTQITKEREWPNAIGDLNELDSALEAGEASGVSDLTIDEIVSETIAEIKVNGEL